jgi:hypothetical protein
MQMSKKMTDWFPPNIKPVHEGVYEVRFVYKTFGKLYARWNGNKWSNSSWLLTGLHLREFKGAEQKKLWRGFTEEQK